MDFIIFSNEYKHFRDAILDNIPDINGMTKRISAAIPPICHILNIGFIRVKLVAPSSIIDKRGTNGEKIIYEDPNGYEYAPLIQTYRTGENGIVTIEVRALKNHKFQNNEIQATKLICDDLFIFLGRTRLMSAIHYASQTDTMTGAPNLPQLIQHGIALKSAKKLQNFTGLFINLKNYKYVNQSKGPAIGDKGIITFANTVMAMCHDDEKMARLGGDNFFILAKRENKEKYIQYLSPLQITIPFPQGLPISLAIHCRIGVYDVQPTDTINEVMHCASIALDEARQHPGNDVVYFAKPMLETVSHEKEAPPT